MKIVIRSTTFALMVMVGCTGQIKTKPAYGQSKSLVTNLSGALYGRLIRLSANGSDHEILGSVTTSVDGGQVQIFSSSDGSSWSEVGTIEDADLNLGACCGTLYELPSAVGSLSAGTVLWAGSTRIYASSPRQMKLKVYKSTNQGRTWSYLSTCASSGSDLGLWEPQFSIASDGALICHYSDETDANHSQLLAELRSYDGLTWNNWTWTVASSSSADRPGMAVVTKLPNGTYFLTFELCSTNGQNGCQVQFKTSSDGWNWGDATNLGTRISTVDGKYLAHSPVNAWSYSPSFASGQIEVIGQVFLDSNGNTDPDNGTVVLANPSPDGSGNWYPLPSPVPVTDAYNNYCPNYSSPILPSPDGTSILGWANDYSNGNCYMYYVSTSSIVGAQNAVADSGFEVETAGSLGSGWYNNGSGNAGVDVNKGNGHSGRNNGWVANNNPSWTGLAQNIAVSPNTQYTLSVWLRCSGDFGTNGYLGVTDSSNNKRETTFGSTCSSSTAGYEQHTVIFNSGADSSMIVYAGFNNGQPSTSWALFDDITVTPQ